MVKDGEKGVLIKEELKEGAEKGERKRVKKVCW